MKLTFPQLIIRSGVAILCVIFAVWLWIGKKAQLVAPPPSVQTEPLPPVPKLLPARQATAESPVSSWERLLAIDGSPAEDRSSLNDIITNYLQSAPHSVRLPLGTNDEITRALTDSDTLGTSAIPTSHPAIVSGQLVDRWGSPWHFHQLAADVIDVRSSGPDRKPFTADDVVK